MGDKSYTDLLNEGIASRNSMDDQSEVNGTRTAASEVSKMCEDLGQSLVKVGDTLSKVANVAIIGAACVASIYLAKSVSEVAHTVREKQKYRLDREASKRYLLKGKEDAIDVVDFSVQ